MEHLPQPQFNDVDDILMKCPRDSAGMYEVGQESLERLAVWLDTLAVLRPEPTPEDIQDGVERARQLEANSTLSDTLADMAFISENRAKAIIGDTPATHIWLEKPLYADADHILGAESFTSWLGRGYQGQGEVAIRESRGKRASLAQITDYATRPTQLPYLSADGGLNLILANDGPFLFSSNAHRAAAAKLRNEPLGFRRLSIYRQSI